MCQKVRKGDQQQDLTGFLRRKRCSFGKGSRSHSKAVVTEIACLAQERATRAC